MPSYQISSALPLMLQSSQPEDEEDYDEDE